MGQLVDNITPITVISAADAGVDQSASLNVQDAKMLTAQFDFSSIDVADGVAKLQDSVDGAASSWCDIPDASVTPNTGASSNIIRVTHFTAKYVRAVWTKNSNTTGTVTVKIMQKQ